jgi:hypothetical protein
MSYKILIKSMKKKNADLKKSKFCRKLPKWIEFLNSKQKKRFSGSKNNLKLLSKKTERNPNSP